ncbi:MAG TPA: peptidoglycan editing factor PgeF [Synechococcales cyanobacterium M55_K2018_004]|nr:peptidoglycan editing factor PgeF [Synechococcales cyanobacterium M55_K2018_004]
MHSWHWHTWQGLSYLTCDLLSQFPHGFFTQHFSPRTPTELTAVLEPQAECYRVHQVHGNTVLTPAEIQQALEGDRPCEAMDSSPFPPADGVVTEQGGHAAWVCTADCVPALVADVRTGQVAAIHAGWRGTATEIVPRAIARLQQQGSRLEDLRVALGPAIAGERYQVSTEVAAQVGATVLAPTPALAKTATATPRSYRPHDATNAIIESLWHLADSPLLPDPEPGKVRLDVRRVNLLQLKRLGLAAEQVAIAPYCTYQTAEHFFSYRRNPQKKVQWSGIVSQ